MLDNCRFLELVSSEQRMMKTVANTLEYGLNVHMVGSHPAVYTLVGWYFNWKF
jgi:hypothetical protein